jgi:molybdopterin converting factor small subunit
MPQTTIRLFGAFRNAQSEAELKIELPDSVRTIADLKMHLAEHWRKNPAQGFNAETLLSKSAIAAETQILLDDAVFSHSARLALLPPVSGG